MINDAMEASQALEAMGQARGKLVAAADCPPWRHVAFAAVMGGLVASQAVKPPLVFGVEAVLLAAIVLIVRSDRRRTGMFVNGYRNGRTRPISFGMLAVTLALYSLGVWLKFDRGLAWAPLACAAVAAPLAFLGSLWWQRVYRREMIGAA